ncbi:hypothetical protein BS50DRAFT_580048 [Corynespora cassiicola Philippines]|uniref:Uncharacterized protein n=1 Tax=Corynespora cassiicola Philippines TaxID=1448308 RepID=A0A2T2N1K4_CORCC|nr:hypothetical protein BS50DRAFT_580048 [Corynespora cassiicola Philippines]
MSSSTDPTVPLPTQTDNDDDDDDNDDGVPDVTSATSAPAPPNPTNPNGASANTLSTVYTGSATTLASGLPSGNGTDSSAGSSGSNGLSAGASAGIGVGVAIAVMAIVIGAWILMRRRRRRLQQSAKSIGNSSHTGDTPDEEVSRRLHGAGVEAYAAHGVSELGSGDHHFNADEKARHYSELASPVVPQEISGGRELPAELPGSAVSVRKMDGPGNGSFSIPRKPQSAVYADQKSDKRLFDDAPIDDRDGSVEIDPHVVDKEKS